MKSNHSGPLPTVVIGGGISGLAAAHRFVELGHTRPLRLLEASPRVGGVLESKSEHGFLWEAAADGFHGGQRDMLDLCRRIGLAGEIIDAAPCRMPWQVVYKGTVVPSPLSLLAGAWPSTRLMLTTPLFSWRGKWRIFCERWVKSKNREDESCASFFIRRFGVEFYSRLIEPVLGGIYSADPAMLGMKALLPRLREQEERFGSLTAAFKKQRRRSPADRKPSSENRVATWTLRGGMSSLTSALAAKLPAGTIELAAPVHRLQVGCDGQWRVEYGRGRSLAAAAVVIATPAHRAAHLLTSVSPQAARLLQHIAYSSVAVVALGYKRASVRGPLGSHGFFVPAGDPFELRSASVTSLKYAGRAPVDAVLIRASLSGERHATILEQSDAKLIQVAHDALSRLLKIDGSPIFARVRRQMFAIPQYRVGHRELIDAVRRRLADFPGLALAGNAYSGIGVPACIASGQQAADQIQEHLNATAPFPAAFAAAKYLTPHTEPFHA